MLMALIANVNRDAKRRPRPYTASDFMPQFDVGPQRPQTPEEQYQIIRLLNRAFGGREEGHA